MAKLTAISTAMKVVGLLGACYAACQVRPERGRACNGKEDGTDAGSRDVQSSVLAAGTGRVVEALFL
jgi:hypothetical protein